MSRKIRVFAWWHKRRSPEVFQRAHDAQQEADRNLVEAQRQIEQSQKRIEKVRAQWPKVMKNGRDAEEIIIQNSLTSRFLGQIHREGHA